MTVDAPGWFRKSFLSYSVYILICFLLRFIGAKESAGIGIKFIVEPKDTIVSTGGSGVLNCAARGEGQPKISWKKDGSLISFVGDTRRSILANGSLHITSLYRTRESRPDEGMYQCFVTLDGVGSILSRSAKLQAASLARFDEEPEDISVGLRQTARFSCAAQGIPPPSVTWFKDDFLLTLDGSRMTVLPSGSLEISQIQTTDEGVYKCNISNIDKHFLSRTGRLALNQNPERDTPPVFTAVPKNQIVIATHSVVLECSTVGYPQPSITWLKDGVTIDLGSLGSRYSLIGEGNLQISNAEESDKGTYQCRAENREDSADVSAALDVHVPPRVLTAPGNFYAYEKEDVELPCKIYGKPMPTIQWFKNGDMIIEGDYFQIVNGNNLKILGCLGSDTAMYQCFGTNPSGNVQASVHLRVLKKGEAIPVIELPIEPQTMPLLGELAPHSGSDSHGNSSYGPSSPRELVALLVSTRFVTLSWKPPAGPVGQITAYAVYYKELGSDRERILNTTQTKFEEVNVQGLLPNKRYTFRVVPYNEKVPGQSSREITVLTQPEVDVPGQPRFLKGWPVSPTRVDLHWAPPEVTNGAITRYKVYYAEASEHGLDTIPKFSAEELDTTNEEDEEDDYLIPKDGAVQSVTVSSAEAVLEDLRIFTEYLIWVVALNENGPGANSEQVRVTTLSDSPTDTPHNVSVEPASSTSIAIRWEPPPMEFRNGIITGYKLKYKQKGRKRAETMTADGNSRLMALTELDRGVEYQIKIAALNVNGTGPFTEWVSASTFQRDLDETQVPDRPNSLDARAMTDSITISWTPPLNTNVMVRGYTIGWGNGIPDVYNKLVDGKRRSFTMEKLKSNSEYVISLRASNLVGDGIPIYENVRTRETSDEDGDDQGHRFPQLPPPVGLRASVISPTSIVLSWTDSSLPKSQVVTDRRHYTVRYIQTDALGLTRPKAPFKYMNSTVLNTILNDLQPNTMYEFSVKVVKNRLASAWSLVAVNKTLPNALTTHSPPEVTPYNAPQDLTLVAMTGEDENSVVILNWQPPKMVKDAEIRGYLIFYTTNPQLKEWVEEAISEDVLTHQVTSLTPDTKYYFRMKARMGSKGFSPTTETKSVTTPLSKKMQDFSANGRPNFRDGESKSSQMLLYVLITLSVVFALASVTLCVYYRKRGIESSPKHNSLKKNRKLELKPPDLWIHHDQMELKGLDKSGHPRSTPITPSGKGSMDFEDLEEKVPLQHTTNSLDKSNYLGSYADGPVSQFHSHSLGRKKPKPIKIPTEPCFFKKTGSGTMDPRNPVYLRNSQSQRGQMLDNLGPHGDGLKPYENVQSGSSTASSQQNLNTTTGQYSATSDYGTQSGSSLGTLGRRGGSNLRSFTVPVPPSGPLIQPTTPQSHKVCIRPAGIGMPPSGSPVKRISASPGYPQSMSPNGGFPPAEPSPLHKCYSTEELSQEISNLEGLMKDLSAITASEFQC